MAPPLPLIGRLIEKKRTLVLLIRILASDVVTEAETCLLLFVYLFFFFTSDFLCVSLMSVCKHAPEITCAGGGPDPLLDLWTPSVRTASS